MDVFGKYEETDPDYASHVIALKRCEQLKEDSSSTVDKFKDFVREEFNKELTQRQSQIEFIEKQIYKTRKLLHLMRNVLISSYYNRRELECDTNEEIPSKADSSDLFSQNRIHPALRKLLGKNTSTPDFPMCRSARRNKKEPKTNLSNENLNQNNERHTNSVPVKSSNSSIGNNGSSLSGLDRNRQKIKYTVIIGNISKWMKPNKDDNLPYKWMNSNEDDTLPYKWMMYVRGPEESPDVSHFIEKVVFYLHPSYKPHDVVEVRNPPFHLSRMGWGEFPIRLQLHFTCDLNKPVEITHHLKLDKTYSGRQTLGNEEIINLYLYDDNMTKGIKSEEQEDGHVITDEVEVKKNEEFDSYEKVNYEEKLNSSSQGDPVSNFEHNYCTEDVKPKVEDIVINQCHEPCNSEHSYSLPSGYELLNVGLKKKPLEPIQQESTPLLYGLDESYSESNEDSKRKEPLFYRKTLVYTTKLPLTGSNKVSSSTNGSNILGTKRKSQHSLLRKMFSNKLAEQVKPVIASSNNSELEHRSSSEVEKFSVSLPNHHLNTPKFKNMGEVLPFLFKRLPLVSDLAKNPTYASLYPFTASSLSEYSSWNIAKQSSSEWSRAKLIRNIINKGQIYEAKKWNTKAIMIYGRSHGYTPNTNFNLIGKNVIEISLINTCFQSPANLPLQSQIRSNEPVIDIENETESPSEKRLKLHPVNVSDTSLNSECAFVRQEALECGILLKNEVIVDNVSFNGSERMILESVKCLINHLVRRSLHHAVTDGCHNGQIAEIGTTHVRRALDDRKEFKSLHEFKTKQTEMKYFFQ